MAGNLLAIHSESVAGTTAATRLNGATFVDACAKLGDAGGPADGGGDALGDGGGAAGSWT